MSDPQNLYKCTPRQVREFVIDVLESGLVPSISSSPGMGKSTIVRGVADELNLQLIDHRMSTSAPEDLSGLPRFNEKGEAVFSPFAELFPLASTPIPEGKDGWLLFLDEFPSASKSVQAAAYKLILDKMVGQHPLHSNVAIVTAGNLMTDRAIVNPVSTAMQSRMVHLEMEINHREWMEDVALKQNWDSRIIAYLSQYPSKLMDFRPDHNEKTFACPRTWEFMNKLIKGKEVLTSKTTLYAGTITSGMAADFVQFTKVFNTLVSVKEILKDPNGCKLPQDSNAKWATITHMMEHITDDTFDDLATYANRFSMDFCVLFYRATMVRHPTLRQHPAFAKALISLAKYLNG